MIRQFIIEKDGKATKNDVIKHMEKYSSRVPTLDMIKELQDTAIINVNKNDNRRGQAHYLRINNENEFNQINQQLSVIDFIIDFIEKPMDRIIRFIRQHPELPQNLREDLIFAYKRSIEKMLEFLLVHTGDTISSEKSSQILYSKIIKSMQKLEHQSYYSYSLDSLERNIDTIQSILSITKGVGYSGVKIKDFKFLIRKIMKFKEQFTSSKQRKQTKM
jgi:hypothetical protein